VPAPQAKPTTAGSEEGRSPASPLSLPAQARDKGDRGEPLPMTTYSTAEAAERTGLSVRALRKRIERDQLRAVQHGRYWRIPVSELERAGLVPPQGTDSAQGTEGTDPGISATLAALEHTQAENVQLRQELTRLRPLPAEVERTADELHRERAEHKAARDELEHAHAWQQRLASAGWRERRRLLREHRHSQSTTDPATASAA